MEIASSMERVSPHPTRPRPNQPLRSSPRLRRPRVFNRRSRVRFGQERTLALIAHLGREPSYPERIIISRIVTIEWELLRQDARLDAGDELSGHATRARLAAENRLRLDLQALGLQPATPRRSTLAELIAEPSTSIQDVAR